VTTLTLTLTPPLVLNKGRVKGELMATLIIMIYLTFTGVPPMHRVESVQVVGCS